VTRSTGLIVEVAAPLPERGDRLLHPRDHRLNLGLRSRAEEAIALAHHAVAARKLEPSCLAPGTDKWLGRFRARLTGHGGTHRRGKAVHLSLRDDSRRGT
jgi:hypothetical protein